MEVVLLIGLQATGKTSFYRARFKDTHELVSKDQFPNARNRQARQMKLLRAALIAGRSVVVDNTNAAREERALLITAARAAGATVVGYYFESKMEESLKRNSRREGKDRVPDVALFSTIKRLERPHPDEGFDRLCYVRIAGEGGFDVEDWIDEEP
jgi:predicted kinase